MDVTTIRDRIVELSHHGIGNDVDVKAQAMAWLNSAYMELMDEVVPFMPDALQMREDVVCDVEGRANLQRAVYKPVRVVDVTRKLALRVVTAAQLLDMQMSGRPVADCCRIEGRDISVYPAAEGTRLAVLYVPQVAPLAEGDLEAAVLLPASLHQVLVWGGLVWSALFERGFMSQSEMMMYQRQWQSGKEQVKLAMFGTGAAIRVRGFDMV